MLILFSSGRTVKANFMLVVVFWVSCGKPWKWHHLCGINLLEHSLTCACGTRQNKRWKYWTHTMFPLLRWHLLDSCCSVTPDSFTCRPSHHSATFNPSLTSCLFTALYHSFNPCQSIQLSPALPPFFVPRSLISILSFSSITPNHLSPFEVTESSAPNLRSIRPSPPAPYLYSVSSSTFHLCSHYWYHPVFLGALSFYIDSHPGSHTVSPAVFYKDSSGST